MIAYNPGDWYWIASSDRIFSSKRQIIITADDASYKDWLASGGAATTWPRDASGDQSVAALQEVLTPFGIFIDLVAYAKNRRWVKENGGISVSGMQIDTDDRSKQLIMGARIAASSDPDFTTPWVTESGTIVTLTSEQVIEVSNAVLALVQSCFVDFSTVMSGLSATPPTITDKNQIDAIFEG